VWAKMDCCGTLVVLRREYRHGRPGELRCMSYLSYEETALGDYATGSEGQWNNCLEGGSFGRMLAC
jgi:hypothetical protein